MISEGFPGDYRHICRCRNGGAVLFPVREEKCVSEPSHAAEESIRTSGAKEDGGFESSRTGGGGRTFAGDLNEPEGSAADVIEAAGGGLPREVKLSESADQYHRHGGRHLYPESLSSGGFSEDRSIMYISGRSCITFLTRCFRSDVSVDFMVYRQRRNGCCGYAYCNSSGVFRAESGGRAVAAVLVGLCRGRSDLTAKTVWNRFTALTARIYREFNLSLNNRKERSERPDSIFHRQILNLTFGKRFRFSDFFFFACFLSGITAVFDSGDLWYDFFNCSSEMKNRRKMMLVNDFKGLTLPVWDSAPCACRCFRKKKQRDRQKTGE